MIPESIQARARDAWAAFQRPSRPLLAVGLATCGRAAGAEAVRDALRRAMDQRRLEGDIRSVGCIGLCYAEPLVEIATPDGRRILYGGVTPDTAAELVRDAIRGGGTRTDLALASLGPTAVDGVPRLDELPVMAGQTRIVLRNAGRIDPDDIDHYLARGGYRGAAAALEQSPEQVIATVSEAALRGRGGAGFSVGRKWALARDAGEGPRYVICNADEGDPGAFMDRAVLESDPHSVLEGLLIAARAVGAGEAFVYVRAEYPLAIQRLETALARMRELGLLGRNILGSGFDCEIAVKQGAGAFVCGEETALIASIEGRRGTPRPRPPYPAASGLYGRPTIINNVETLASVAAILRRGPAWFREFGTRTTPGTKTFALAGKIQRTGLVEVPMGTSLRDIIFKLGGGVPGGKAFKAVQTGGPSGGCLPGALLDLPVDYEKLAEAGSIMGSGGMIVLDEDSCMVDIARYFLAFTESESCGQCTPCRMGSQHLLSILESITRGRGRPGDLDRLRRLARTVQDGSLCGLGRTLPNPVLSTLRYFEDEFRTHIENRRCPAGVCKALFQYRVEEDKCTACGLCKRRCPHGAVEGERRGPHRIVPERCTRCGLCYDLCPVRAIVKS